MDGKNGAVIGTTMSPNTRLGRSSGCCTVVVVDLPVYWLLFFYVQLGTIDNPAPSVPGQKKRKEGTMPDSSSVALAQYLLNLFVCLSFELQGR